MDSDRIKRLKNELNLWEKQITKAQRTMNNECLDPDTMKLRDAVHTGLTGIWLLSRTMIRVLDDL